MGRGLILDGQPRPHPNGAGSQRSPNFLGILLFMRTQFVAELPNLTCGEGIASCQPRLSSKESGVSVPHNFGGSPLFMPTQRPNWAW